MELTGKTALITGAGSAGPIGAATAQLFADQGAQVITTGRDQQRGEAVANTIRTTVRGARRCTVLHRRRPSAATASRFQVTEEATRT
jgi:NAD(P)-dependent dehydrogenase (short-subunit alcohol dehydrogenase family)